MKGLTSGEFADLKKAMYKHLFNGQWSEAEELALENDLYLNTKQWNSAKRILAIYKNPTREQRQNLSKMINY